MIIFYTQQIEGAFARLEAEEARHCTQVLRRKEGDHITLVDGRGGWYEGVISHTTKKEVEVTLNLSKSKQDVAGPNVHLAVAPTKNIARTEWFLEKATELGITEITPILCRRSERKNIRLDRLEKIVLSAMKQSMKAFLPRLNPLTKLEELNWEGQSFIAHCEDRPKSHLWNNYEAGNDVCILIGPEGDFHPEEIDWALEQGFTPVSLGTQRLRTETAAVAAVQMVQMANEIA